MLSQWRRGKLANSGGVDLFEKGKHLSMSAVKSEKSKNINKIQKLLTSRALMLAKHRQGLVAPWQEQMSMSDGQYKDMGQALIDKLLEFYQSLPETRNSYFSQKGGLVEHALSRTAAALSLCRAYFISDAKHKNELSGQQQLWMYALFSAALLQGIGKLSVDLIVELYDDKGNYLKRWQPLEGSMLTQGYHYDYDFDESHPEPFKHQMSVLLARQLMPAGGFAWIASDKDVLQAWLALLMEDMRGAGTLGPILIKADALALNQFFSERKGLSEFIKSGEALKFSKAATSFNLSQAGQSIDGLTVAREFLQWLNESLANGTLMINKSPLFMVPGGLLMNPDIFKYFIREHPQFKSWQTVQTSLAGLNLHSHGVDGQAIQHFAEVNGKQKVSGMVLENMAMVLPEKLTMVNLESGAKKNVSAMDLLNSRHLQRKFAATVRSQQVNKMNHLSASGEWSKDAPEASAATTKPGNKQH